MAEFKILILTGLGAGPALQAQQVLAVGASPIAAAKVTVGALNAAIAAVNGQALTTAEGTYVGDAAPAVGATLQGAPGYYTAGPGF